MIYLDNAASTPLLPEVIAEMHKLMSEVYGNPSSIHSQGRLAKVLVEESRKTIAELINAAPSEIIFTSGGTEANHLALWSCVQTYDIKHIITSKTEHPAVLKPVYAIADALKVKVSYLDVDTNGHINTSQLDDKLASISEPVLLSLMHANNETGALLHLKDVSEICKAHNTFFHSDMVQTFGKFAMNFEKIKVGFASCSAHKFHGPKGVGFLYVNEHYKINPLILGGSQERNMRAGTENIWSIAGMAKALEIANNSLEKNQAYILSLKTYMADKLRIIEGIKFNTSSDLMGLHTILSIAFPRNPNTEMLIYRLDMEGVAVSGGSACASGSVNPSPVLQAIYGETNEVSLRISFSKYNTFEELDKVIALIKDIVTS